MRRLSPLLFSIVTLVACGSPAPIRSPAPPETKATSRPAPDLDPTALQTMLVHAREQGTHAIVVLRHDRVVYEDYFGGEARPIVAMSATKSVASMAIGALLRVKPEISLDDPIAKTFPKWNDDPRKAKVTLRHLLNHTSGIAVDRADFWGTETFETRLTNAPMKYEPGKDFRYNNAAVDFLSAFVFKHVSMRLDDFLQKEVFGPIGLVGAYWMTDAGGHPAAAGEMFVAPREFAKLGQLMLHDGVWNGRRILAEGWVAQSTRPSQAFTESCGMLWWLDAKRSHRITDDLLDVYRDAGMEPAQIDRLRPFLGRSFPDSASLHQEIPKDLSYPAGRLEHSRVKLEGPVRAYYAKGWIGQYLVVVPSAELIAVRMRNGDEADRKDSTPHEYPDFVKDVRALVGDKED